MEINISTRHGHLSDSARAKVETKVGKLSRFFDRVSHVDVTIDLQNEDSPEAEILLRTESKHDFVAKEKAGNLMSAIEASVHKVEQQIKKYKTKLQDHRGPGTGQASAAVQENLNQADESDEQVNLGSEPAGDES